MLILIATSFLSSLCQRGLFNTVYGVFMTPLNFHEFHKLFWICEIKFVKCCRNVIAILVAILKFLVITHGFVKI